MQIAARMDFSRSQAIVTDGRVLALALASGIAGLCVVYPTATVGHGTVDALTGKLEAKSPFLALPAAPRNVLITTTFLDSAQVAADVMRAGSIGLSNLSNALAPQITSLASGAARDPAGIAPETTPRAVALNFIENPHFVASKSSQGSAHGPVIRTTVPQAVERTPVDRGAPLDAVRIALPPATMERGLTGVMPPEATLGSVTGEPAAPAPHPDAQPLAVSSSPQALAAPAPAALSRSEPFSLSSAPEEVRKFDLARFGSGNPEAKSLARASADALAAAAGRSTPRTPDLPRVVRVPDRIVGDHIIHVAALSLEGMPSGNLSVRIGMGGDLSVRLSDLLAPVRTQMAPDTFERLAGSAAASEYVSFADLRAAGFDIRYEAGGDRLMVSAQL